MKLPNKPVFGFKFKVKEVKNFEDAGQFSADKKTIFIKKEMSNEDKILSYYHENVHLVSFRTGIWQTVSHNHDLEELYAENMSNYFHEFIKENLDWIIENYQDL